jgi:hypothetical protein
MRQTEQRVKTFVVLSSDGDAREVHPNWDLFLDHRTERVVFEIISTPGRQERDRNRETETERQ